MLFFGFLAVLIAAAVAWIMGFGRNSSSAVTGAKSSGSPAAGSPTRPNAAALTEGQLREKRPVLILFGSQTGTAELFAKTLVREGARLGVPCRIEDVESYETYTLEQERLVILVCATYGEGEPTDTMKNFHDWLVEDIHQVGEEFKGVKFTVFGLGDKQYKYFCEESICMDRRLDELGAQRIYGLGCGDAGADIEEQFDEWRRDLWPAVGRALNIEIKADTEEPVEPECRFKSWEEAAAPLPFPKMASVLEPTHRLPAWVSIEENRELLTNVTDRSTRHVALSIKDTIISYQGGDHLGILPHNPASLVDQYLQLLGASNEEAEQVFSLQDKKTLKNVFPARVSVRTALTWYVDLAGPPKKSTLRAFAHYCSDPKQKEELLAILRVSHEAQKEFAKLCGKLRTVYGFLRKYNSAKIPLPFFLEMMPRISPRYFSISSDQLTHPTSITATVAIVDDGLCTQMLKGMKEGDRLPIFVRKSAFHLPLRAKDRPLVMVGPGTGVAPLIGFLYRRRAWQSKNNQLGKAMLFYGCRRQDEDHVYQDFMGECLKDGTLTVLDTAYSRAQEKKVYVQDRLRERSAEVWEVLKGGGNLYLCGDAKYMAKDVEKVLVEIIVKEGGQTQKEAEAFLAKLEEQQRFLKDVWSN